MQEEEKIRRKAEEEQRKKEEETRRLLEEERKRIEEEKKRLEAERQAAEEAKRKEKEERERKQKEEEERRKKEEETRRLLEEERKRIEEEKKRLEAERQAAEEAKRKEKEESERKKKEEEQRKKAEEEQKKKEEEEARLLEKKRRLIEEQRKKDEERLRAKNANRQSALLKIIDSNFIVNGSKARSFVSYDDVLQICGRGATSSGDNCSVLNIDDDNILSPHLIIKYDYKNNCYLIAVIGETCLNGRKLSKDPSKWLKLPNNSFLMLNGEIEMDFNIINPQQDNNDKPELSTIEDESYIDLGLPSGTKWKPTNETNPNSNDGYDFFSYDEAVAAFGEKLPTKIQWEELMDNCTWSWDSNKKGYTVVGPNGNNIFLPAAGSCVDYTESLHIGKIGVYWSSTPNGPDYIWYIHFDFLVEKKIYIADGGWRAFRYSVRLVKI